MILFFGPAGAGKSMQGQLLAARYGWQWVSTGNMFRSSKDQEIIEHIKSGNLVSDELTNKVVGDFLDNYESDAKLVLDGYPRNDIQAKWLTDRQESGKLKIDLAVVFEVPRQELVNRLGKRGRDDDTPEAVDKRLGIYRKDIYPILDFLNNQNIPIVHINGVGTVGQVHDTISAEIESRGLAG